MQADSPASAFGARNAGPPQPPRTDLRTFLTGLWRLAKAYYTSEDSWWAWGLTLVTLAFLVSGVGAAVGFAGWTRDFFDVLEARDAGALPGLLGQLALLVLAIGLLEILELWSRLILEFRWRHWLTDRFFERYFQDRRYQLLELGDYGIDNADQRISIDLADLTRSTVSLAGGFVSNGVRISAFAGVLWSISGVVNITLLGREWTIHGYLVWVAVLYAAVSSLLAYWIGRPLIPLRSSQQQLEADLRFNLIRVRENAEGIAMTKGQPFELNRLRELFDFIQANFYRIVARSAFLNGFRNLSNLSGGMIVSAVANAPRYLAGAITLGTITQSQQAFQQMQSAMAWFVNSFDAIAEWKASSDRVLYLERALAAASADRQGSGLSISIQPAQRIDAKDLAVRLPDGACLVEGADVSVNANEHALISGPSGSGKSTLFRVLAGIWPWGSGEIALPQGKAMFLPQRPYLPNSALAEVLAYPGNAADVSREACADALRKCELAGLVEALDEEKRWANMLSGGEQQRVALARAVLQKPDWLFLDEASAAMDGPMEERLYAMLKRALPNTTIISIGHRASLDAHHSRKITLDPSRLALRATALTPRGAGGKTP